MAEIRPVCNIDIKTSDPSFLMDLFGSELPENGTKSSFSHDVVLKTEHVEVQHGFVESTILVTCVLQVMSGIAIKVIGDLLVDRFKGKKAGLTINGKKLNEVTILEIEEALKGISYDDR